MYIYIKTEPVANFSASIPVFAVKMAIKPDKLPSMTNLLPMM
jgi:hypothetical protein